MASDQNMEYSQEVNQVRGPLESTTSQERLLNVVGEVNAMKNELQSFHREIRDLRITAADELVETSLLYEPTIRSLLAEAFKAANEAKNLKKDEAITIESIINNQ